MFLFISHDFMSFHDFTWFHVFSIIHVNSLDFVWFHVFLNHFTWFHLILLPFTWFYFISSIVRQFYVVSHDFVPFHIILWHFIKFHDNLVQIRHFMSNESKNVVQIWKQSHITFLVPSLFSIFCLRLNPWRHRSSKMHALAQTLKDFTIEFTQ